MWKINFEEKGTNDLIKMSAFRWRCLLKLFLYYVHLCTIIIYIMDFDKILMEVRGGKKSMQFAERMDRFGEGIFSNYWR